MLFIITVSPCKESNRVVVEKDQFKHVLTEYWKNHHPWSFEPRPDTNMSKGSKVTINYFWILSSNNLVLLSEISL